MAQGFSRSGSITYNTYFYNTLMDTFYAADKTPGSEVYIKSCSEVEGPFSWTRDGNTLTIQYPESGLLTGDVIHVYSANVFCQSTAVVTVNAETVTIACPDSGETSGGDATVSFGYKMTHIGGSPRTGGVLTAPANKYLVLNTLKIRTDIGSTYTLSLPPCSDINNVLCHTGMATGLNNIICPIFRVHQDIDTLAILPATIAVNQDNAGYNVYKFGGLGAAAIKHITVAW